MRNVRTACAPGNVVRTRCARKSEIMLNTHLTQSKLYKMLISNNSDSNPPPAILHVRCGGILEPGGYPREPQKHHKSMKLRPRGHRLRRWGSGGEFSSIFGRLWDTRGKQVSPIWRRLWHFSAVFAEKHGFVGAFFRGLFFKRLLGRPGRST